MQKIKVTIHKDDFKANDLIDGVTGYNSWEGSVIVTVIKTDTFYANYYFDIIPHYSKEEDWSRIEDGDKIIVTHVDGYRVDRICGRKEADFYKFETWHCIATDDFDFLKIL